MITLKDLQTIGRDDVIVIPEPTPRDPNRTMRWRVNGQVKLWKRSPERVRVPVKYGLYSYDAITEDSIEGLNLRGATIQRAAVR